MNQLININQNLIMSSREIAELTGKEHSNVMRDIRLMLESLQNSDLNPVCNSTTYVGENGQKYSMYELDKDTTLTLLLGYDAVARMRVVKRWQELENQQAPKLPQTYAEALLEAGRLALELETQNKRIEKLFHTEKNFTSTMIAKEAGWKSAQEMHKALQGAGYIYKHRGIWELYAKYADKGYQIIKSKEFENGHIGYTMEWTMSGREWLLDVLESL